LSSAILILSPSHAKYFVILAWMPESRHKDVKLRVDTTSRSSTCAADKLPSMALDTGIHAGTTAVLAIMRIAVFVEGIIDKTRLN
jgi:hypothetical protein